MRRGGVFVRSVLEWGGGVMEGKGVLKGNLNAAHNARAFAACPFLMCAAFFGVVGWVGWFSVG